MLFFTKKVAIVKLDYQLTLRHRIDFSLVSIHTFFAKNITDLRHAILFEKCFVQFWLIAQTSTFVLFVLRKSGYMLHQKSNSIISFSQNVHFRSRSQDRLLIFSQLFTHNIFEH